MADTGPLVRVDRGDGKLIKMTTKEAEAFVASHAGAKIAPARVIHDGSTEAEEAATVAQAKVVPIGKAANKGA